VRHLQAVWMAMTSADLSKALIAPKNIAFPNLKVSRLLLLAGASPDSVLSPETKESLVIWYASQQNLDMVQLLSQFGADLNASNSEGITALMVASAR
jgi:ankyrin repeat protein